MKQEESEALVRLMLVAKYQDASLTMAESDALQKRLEALPWASGTGQSLFVMQETARVRRVLADPEKRKAFIAEQCGILAKPGTRDAALHALEDVLAADGSVPSERELLSDIRTKLSS